jgi:hypothetical protein
VRYPTPLEGRWVSTRPDRFTLVIRNAYVDMWRGVGQSQGQPLARRMMVVLGHRVLFRSLLAPDETATYRWRIAHERLRFRLLEQTATSAWSLAGLTFKPQV